MSGTTGGRNVQGLFLSWEGKKLPVGLDARYHDNWNLYTNLPAEWKVGDYVGAKEELEV